VGNALVPVSALLSKRGTTLGMICARQSHLPLS
jgi:hypothetical protein